MDALLDWWLGAFDEPTKELKARIAAVEAEQATIKARGTVAHVMQERPEEAMAFVLFRGEYDKRRDPVKAGTPAVLPPMPSDLPRNRLGFAQWLLRPEHPLTARVTVNRFWQEVFGTGLVRTAGDFGDHRRAPLAPRAARLAGGRVPRVGLGREAVLQAAGHVGHLPAVGRDHAREAGEGPGRTACSRAGRGSAWTPRWSATTPWPPAACWSGKIGGPSVKPYQPDGVWEAVAMPGSNTRDYKQDTGEGLYRRSLYTFWKRAAPPASMDIFNAPSRETCTVRRERTNTPLQALVTLNDPQFVEAARHLAQHALKEGGATHERPARLHRPAAPGPAAPPGGGRRSSQASLDDLLVVLPGPPEGRARP